MYRNTAGDGWTALQVAVAAIAALVSLCAAAYSVSQVDSGRTQRMETHAAQMSYDISELQRRVTRIERPDEPVHLPRHPGRIGGKPVIPWIEPWSGSASPTAPSIGASIDSEPTIGRTIDQ